jgi:hypothetical protein
MTGPSRVYVDDCAIWKLRIMAATTGVSTKGRVTKTEHSQEYKIWMNPSQNTTPAKCTFSRKALSGLGRLPRHREPPHQY